MPWLVRIIKPIAAASLALKAMSLRSQLILGIAVIQGCLMAILIGVVFKQIRVNQDAQQAHYAHPALTTVAALARNHLAEGRPELLLPLVESVTDSGDIAYARILGADGRTLAASGRRANGSASGNLDLATEVTFAGEQPPARVEISLDITRLERTFEQAYLQIWLLAGLGMVLAVVFSLILGAQLKRPQREPGQAPDRRNDDPSGNPGAGRAQERLTLAEQRTNVLEEVNRKWLSLIENLPINVVCYDTEARIRFTSTRAGDFTTTPSSLLNGKRISELPLADSDEVLRIEALVRSVLASGEPAETEIRFSSGTGQRIHQVRMVAERNSADETIGVLAVGMDITEHRKGESRLALMSFAINKVSEAALLIDEQATIHFANIGAGETLGYSPEAMIGMNLGEIRPSFDPTHWAAHWHELKTRGSMSYEMLNRHRDGRELHMEINATYFEVDGIGYDLALGRDISTRKQMEQARNIALEEAKKLAQAKSEFLANMSHEIRTPLNSILGMAQLGLRVSPTPQGQSQFAAILDAGQLLQSLVDDILDFSKLDAGKLSLEPSRVVLGELIDRVVDLTAARAYAKGLDYSVREAVDLPESFAGDPFRLSQVLVNLLANAIKFTDAGSISLSVTRDVNTLDFCIADTGIGMSEEQIARLFTPFEQADGSTTRRFGGTGLGLAISKHLAELMGGRISAEGLPGQGMTFRVRLPMTDMLDRANLNDTEPVLICGPSCAIGLAAELRDWGVETRLGSLEIAEAGTQGLVVIPYSVLGHWDGLAQIRRVAVILPPGSMHILAQPVMERIEPLPWPPRSRHLRRLLDGQPCLPAVPSVDSNQRLAGLRLVIAEDNDLNRMILESLLEYEGALVTCVENGFQLVEQVLMTPTAYDLVITDVQMPDMDGYEATRRILEQVPGLPIIGLTAHVLGKERQRCLDSGMVAHIAKPVQIDLLVSTILEHIPATTPANLAQMCAERPPEISSPTQGVIDWKALDAAYMGREDLIRKACALLVSSHAGMPERLRDLARQDARQALIRLTHTIKGMAGNLLANEVQALATSLEDRLGTDDAIDTQRVDELADALQQLLETAANRFGE